MENNFFIRVVLIGFSLIFSVAMMNNGKSRMARFFGLLLYLATIVIILWF